ncbi:hypothetical protein BDV24DRAFT_170006 [Aspergillus arachidicola]|uniref:Uncharacterized protein n=1 Tax=Aspergillus arachidicola TaxID=656916 RepID=A0A5N6XT04_9EURO|nr:hypothetical protein BDV24DRAFT_170006 [Aspergillus arachidicola]
MAGFEWTDEEIAIVLYFSVLGVRQSDIVLLLNQRMFYRTKAGVEGKIADLRVKNNLGRNARHLEKSKVYAFIDRLSIPAIDLLLEPTAEDQEIVDRCGKDINLWVEYIMWRISREGEMDIPLQPNTCEMPHWL